MELIILETVKEDYDSQRVTLRDLPCEREYIDKNERTSSWRTNSSSAVPADPHESSSPSRVLFNGRITHLIGTTAIFIIAPSISLINFIRLKSRARIFGTCISTDRFVFPAHGNRGRMC